MDEKLLLRFLTKECTSEDIRVVDQWVTANPENARWLFEMEEIWAFKKELKYSDNEEIKRAYHRFLKEIERPKAKQIKLRKYFIYTSAAAIAIILVLLSFPIFKSVHNNTILNNLSENINVNEINVPNGQNITVKLADGTTVWLNSGSRLIYPAEFSVKNRAVKLIGEGFFEVEHNKKSPFVVFSGNVRTKVLGTKFNVKAYQNEAIRISLLEGGIEVSTGKNEDAIQLLEPDQQVEISIKGSVKKTKVSSLAIVQWTKGELYFENESLENIVATLKRKYNVNITITNDNYKDMVLNSRINKDTSLENVLNVLKGTRNIDFFIRGDSVYIY